MRRGAESNLLISVATSSRGGGSASRLARVAAAEGDLGAWIFYAVDRWIVQVAGAWASRCPAVPACPPSPPCPPCPGAVGWDGGALLSIALASAFAGGLFVRAVVIVAPQVNSSLKGDGTAVGLGSLQRRGRKAALAPEESGGPSGVVGYRFSYSDTE